MKYNYILKNNYCLKQMKKKLISAIFKCYTEQQQITKKNYTRKTLFFFYAIIFIKCHFYSKTIV